MKKTVLFLFAIVAFAAMQAQNMSNTTVTACSGTFYDSGGPASNYADNENLTMTFCSGTTDYLQFTFSSFTVSAGDSLFIFDGASTAAQRIGVYTNGSAVEQFTSTGTCITFQFKSNASGNSAGWQAGYACVTVPQAPVNYNHSTGIRYTCSGTFNDNGGPSGNYGSNANITETFYSSNGNRVQFAFSSFGTESGFDYLYIYDGPTTAYPLIGTYTGGNNPGTIISSGTALTFRFTSDASGSGLGWSASVSCTTPVLPVYNMSSGTVTACSGVFYDFGGAAANYPNSENRTMTFCSGTSDFLQFTFNNVALSFAANDSLFVYDGANTSAPRIAVYTAASRAEQFTSSGTCVTFVFKSDASTNAAGWQATFACVTSPQPPTTYIMSSGIRYTCGGTFTDNGGTTGNYGNNASLTQTFVSYNGARLEAAFSSFSTESGFDFFYIYDGPTTSYPLIGVYSGGNNPGTITASGTALTFRFTSDATGTSSGWNASFSCTTPVLPVYNMSSGTVTACSGVFYDFGGAAANYPNSENRTMTFCSGTSDFLQFTFNNVALAFAANDSLFVYDGANTSAPRIAVYTAASRAEQFTSTGSCVTFVFKSDASTNAAGWQATFACVTSPQPPTTYIMSSGIRYTCGGTFTDNGGTTGNYGNNASLTQTFVSYNGARLEAAFSSFSTESGFDFFYIYDGPTTSYPLIGVYSGGNNPGTITASGTALTFRFTSDATGTSSGWNASFSCTTPVLPVYNMSSGTVTACSGVFYDFGGAAANYPNSENRTMTFCSGTSDFLQFTFNNVALAFAANDSLFVYDGANTSAPRIAVYTAASRAEQFTSTGSCVTFVFKSDASTNAAGWQATFACVTSPQPPTTYLMSSGIRYTCGGTFTDNGGTTGNYGNNSNQSQTFVSYNGNRLAFTFSNFSTESGFDFLYVYDGPTTAYPLIGVYSGSGNPGTITSTGSALTFRFTSDASSNSSGWNASISCTTPTLPTYNLTSGTVTICDAVLYDNGGPTASYSNNANNTMTFISASGQYLQAAFTALHHNIAAGDTLYIYDGTSIAAPLLAKLSSAYSPGTITSNTSALTFRFASNATTNQVGWRAILSCVSAPNNTPTFIMGGGTYYTCGGTFYDSGGPTGNYSNGEGRIMSFNSNSGCGINVAFNSFSTEGGFDLLRVYDGPTTASPLIGTYSGGGLPPAVQSSGNILTFQFTSDASSNYAGWNATITCPNQPLATITPNGSTTICSGDSVTLTAANNTAYLWSNGATTQSIVVHNAGSYWVTVTNANGCTATSSITNVTVVNGGSSSITASGATTFCQGGSVTLSASSGTAWLWSTGATTQSITVNTSGTYTVTVTGLGGCPAGSVSQSVTVNPNPPSTITSSGPTSICVGDNVTLSAPAGYSYLWSTGATTQSITTGTAGTYSVVVTNPATSCQSSSTPVTVVVSTPPTAGITASGTTTFCQGGSVTLTATGGTSYLWSTGATTASIAVTLGGSYSVTAYNGGCSNTSAPVTVTVNALPTVTLSLSSTAYCVNGPVTTLTGGSPAGGTWSGTGVSGNTFNPATPGPGTTTINYTYTDGNGCSNTASQVVTVNGTPPATITPSGPTTICTGDNITLTAPAGYNYLWSNGATTQSITTGTAGTYSVIVTDPATTCQGSSSPVTVVVNTTTVANVTTSGSTTFCQGGSVTLTASGGNSYVWSNGATSSSITVNQGGNYYVVAAIGNCIDTSAVIPVTVNALPNVTLSLPATTFCINDPLVTLSGGSPAGGTWSGTGVSGNTFDPAAAGIGTSVIYYNYTDGNSCSNLATQAVTVYGTPPATISTSGSTTLCTGDSVTLSAPAGYSYLWSNGATTQSITTGTAGTYSVIVTNPATTCQSSSSPVTVVVNAPPTATITAGGSTTFCQGSSVTLNGNGGSSYLWSTGATTSAITVTQSGNYYVIAITGSCSDTSAVIPVTVNALPGVSLSLPVDTFCNNGPVFTLSGESPAGGTWSGSGVSGNTFNPAASGNGLVTISYTYTDGNNCSNTASQQVWVDICNSIVNEAGTVNSLNVFPNPARGQVTVTWTGAHEFITILDHTGKVVEFINTTGKTNVTIDLTNYACGIYLVRAGEAQARLIRQ